MAFSEVFTDLNAKFIETVNGHHPRRWVALFSVTGRAGGRDEDMEPPRQSRQRKLLDRGSVVGEQGTWTGNINVPDLKGEERTSRQLSARRREGWCCPAHQGAYVECQLTHLTRLKQR